MLTTIHSQTQVETLESTDRILIDRNESGTWITKTIEFSDLQSQVGSGGGAGGSTAVAEYNFNGITTLHVSRKAWSGTNATPTALSPGDIESAGSAFSNANYDSIATQDGGSSSFSVASTSGARPYVMAKFRIGQQPRSTEIGALAHAQFDSATGPIKLYIWNHVDTNWVELAAPTPTPASFISIEGTESDVTPGAISDAVVDSGGWVYVLVVGDDDADALTLSLDYVAVQVVGDLVGIQNGEAGPVGPAGPAGGGGGGGSAIEYEFSTPQSTWVIEHNLGYPPAFSVVLSTGQVVEADGYHENSDNTLRIEFASEVSGRAILF